MFTFRTARAALTVAALVGGLTAVVRPTPSALAAPGDGILTVDIYRTFTELTTYNPALDVGQPGIVVTVTDPDGTSISSPTDANGQAVFNLDAAVGMDGGRYRVDAVIPASLDFLEPAHAGTGGALNTLRSLTNFVDMTGGDVEIRMAVWNPADYAQDDPTLAIATQVNAYVDDVDETRALLSIPWTARGDLDGSSGVVTLNEQVDVGATFGIAYDRHRERVFQAAFAKSFTSYGPAGQGAIYVTDLGGATTTFAVVPSAGSTAHSGGAHDDSFYGVPGTESLGGIALSENGAELYVVNLNDGNLYVYDATGATGGTPQVRGAGSEAAAGCQAGHWRPGTATFKDGVLYVGGVCSGPTAADLSVSIQRWDGADWIAAFSHPLTFSRGQIYTGNNASSPEFWHPWSFTYPPAGMLGDPGGEATRPEPWLSAFTFDREGSIIFGFRDRFADMTVDENYSHDSGGDLNKACSNGDGTWSWEGTGGCPTNPSHPSQAAGVTEFFVGDYFSDGSIFHFETAQGSIVAPLREAQLVSSTMDPISPQAFSIGLGWFNHADGQGPGHSVTNGAIINTDTTWNTTSPLPNSGFTKGNGLSGVTVLADLAPIQIGNRVWIDTDRDGIQDGDEDPVPGVIVELRDENGDFVATTTTDVNGEYYFDVAPGTTYQVVVVAENFAPGGALEGWHVTVTDAGGDDTIDSDGVQTVPLGDFTATVTTGGPGENDHTIDFGVFLPSVDIEKGDSGPEGSATPGVIVNDADTSPDGVGYDDGETREVVFTVVNDGNADLYQVTVTDQTIGGDADVVGLECTFPGDAGPTAGTFDAGDGWVVAWGASFGADPVAWGPGVEFTCTAALTLTGTGAPHVDRAEVHTSLTAGGTPGTIPTDGPSDEDDYVAFTGAIQVIKYDGNETDPTIGTGPDAWVTPTKPLPGDADTTGTAIVYLPDTVEPVRWVVTNTGQTWLTDVTLTDTTNTGPDVTDWTCDLSPFGGPTDYDFTSPWVGPFPPGASFFCQGELSLPAGVTHTDTVDVEAIVVVPVLDDDGQPVDDDQDGYPDYETDDNEPVRSDIVV
ncbi:MAG TPA: SdrD B-like domain-containing protein, partial [Ilumatobacter sp.]|nr:SdrD B-like domain-containing protein [Ilumatobacter sp.]